MAGLRPDEHVHKFLVSTPARFVGEYEAGDYLITHAWSGMFEQTERSALGFVQGPYSRNYYLVAFRTSPERDQTGNVVPPYNARPTAERACSALAVLFGKRFDLHGPVESHGHYHAPEMGTVRPVEYSHSGPFNHRPRVDLGLELNLAVFEKVARLFTDGSLDEHLKDVFFAAARFYRRSLQVFDLEPDVAYLDLITCGEILAEYFEYPDEVVYGADILDMLAKVRAIPQDGKRIAGEFKGRMRQIKRRFTRTVVGLLNDYFFTNTETANGSGKLERSSGPHPGFDNRAITIENRVEESYNVRSSYVHSGAEFARFVRPMPNFLNETQLGWYTAEGNGLDRRLAKALSLAPTYLGLERIMRYCLVRFLHLNGVTIDPRLDGPPSPPLPGGGRGDTAEQPRTPSPT